MIGGKSYDEYLRDQERKNKGYGIGGKENYRPEVPSVEQNGQKTQIPPRERKKIQPVCVFFVAFGFVFFLFGLFFLILFLTVLPAEEDLIFVYFVPVLFMVIGLAFVLSGIYFTVTGQTPQNITVNGLSPEMYNLLHGYGPEESEAENKEEKEEDSSRLSTDWKS